MPDQPLPHIQMVRDAETLALAQVRFAELIGPRDRFVGTDYDTARDLTIRQARTLTTNQAALNLQLAHLCHARPALADTRDRCRHRAEQLLDIRREASPYFDLDRQPPSGRYLTQQTEITRGTAALTLTVSHPPSDQELGQLDFASDQAATALAYAIQRQLTRAHSHYARRVDHHSTLIVGSRRGALTSACQALLDTNRPPAPPTRWINPQMRRALRATLNDTPTPIGGRPHRLTDTRHNHYTPEP